MNYTEFSEKFHICLNDQQAAAVQAAEGPVLVLAVPGSGKTTVLVTRVGYLCQVRRIPARQILTITFTTSAARDMRERFCRIFGPAEDLEFRTINSLCVRIIRTYEQVRNRTAFRLMNREQDMAGLLSQIYRKTSGEFLTESTRKTILQGITYIKNAMLTPEQIRSYRPDGIDLCPIYHAYCKALRSNGLMDFDDQLVYALRILETCPEILEEFQNHYRYISVDEAQDTSRIQHAIIQLLTGENRNLFMVGDEDQSIYGFRAACPSALLHFKKTYSGAALLFLEQNYRSTEEIVSAAERVIQGNLHRKEKHMVSVRGPSGVPVKALRVADRAAQFTYLADMARDCPPDTAVLYRNNESALPLIDLLDRQGIPYCCRQFDATFFSHRIVTDVRDLIHFGEEPADWEIFLQLYYKLNAAIPKEAALRAAAMCRDTGKPVLELLMEDRELSQFARKRCAELQADFKALAHDRGGEAIDRITWDMGYLNFLESREAPADKLRILQLLGRHQPSARSLLDRLDALSVLTREGSRQEGGLILSTIHSSKGLEYSRVYLADLLDGVFPAIAPADIPKDLETMEEERRLLYVAMTRAREELYVFRFRQPVLTSVFAREIFPPAPRPSAPARKPSRKQLDDMTRRFYPGSSVEHRLLGTGTVVSTEDQVVEILFASGEKKRFLLTTLLEQGLIE